MSVWKNCGNRTLFWEIELLSHGLFWQRVSGSTFCRCPHEHSRQRFRRSESLSTLFSHQGQRSRDHTRRRIRPLAEIVQRRAAAMGQVTIFHTRSECCCGNQGGELRDRFEVDHSRRPSLRGGRCKGQERPDKAQPRRVRPVSTINTDPRLIGAAVEALRSMGAASVVVAEGPGHRRDTEYIVRERSFGSSP